MATLDRLVQQDEPTWKLFLDELNPPLMRGMLEVANGDQTKVEDYVSNMWVLIAQAIKRVGAQQAAAEQKALSLLLQGDETFWMNFGTRMHESLRDKIGRVVDDKETVEDVAGDIMVSIVANLGRTARDLDLLPKLNIPSVPSQ